MGYYTPDRCGAHAEKGAGAQTFYLRGKTNARRRMESPPRGWGRGSPQPGQGAVGVARRPPYQLPVAGQVPEVAPLPRL